MHSLSMYFLHGIQRSSVENSKLLDGMQRGSGDASTSDDGCIPTGDQATAVLATRYRSDIICLMLQLLLTPTVLDVL